MEENKRLIILDASVILKWFLWEKENLEEAKKIQEEFIARKINLIVPSHCFFELANTLKRKVPDDALNIISKLKLSEIMEQAINIKVISLAFKLMESHKKISFYDAAYHALALAEDGIFVTADENYYKITKGHRGIMLLKNYC